MSRRMLIGLTLTGLLSANAAGQIPPGYEVVQVTSSPFFDQVPKIVTVHPSAKFSEISSY